MTGGWGGDMFTRPDPDDPTPKPPAPPKELDNDAAYYWRQYREAMDQIKTWEASKAEAKSYLIDYLGEATVGTMHGVTIVKYTKVHERRLDQTLLRQGYPDVHAACVTDQTYNKLTVNELPVSND